MLNKSNFLILSALLAYISVASCMDSDTVNGSITLPYVALEGYTDLVNAITTLQTRDGRVLLASGGYDETIRIWNLSDDSFPCIFTQKSLGQCHSICLTETATEIYMIWGFQRPSNGGFVCATPMSHNPRPLRRFGPYEHAPFQIIEKESGVVLWSHENNRLIKYEVIKAEDEKKDKVATLDGEYIHGLCMLDSNWILKRVLTQSKVFYAQKDIFQQGVLFEKLFDTGRYRFDMFMMNKEELITTNPEGFTVWDINNDHHAARTVKINLPTVMFDNCCRYSDDTLIVYPGNVQQSGFYLISYADGSVIQHITSDVLNQKDIFQNKLLVTDKFIIYTVVDRSPERSNKDLETKIFVSKKPN